MILWNKNVKLRFIIRIISIILIQTFLAYDISWATGGEVGASKLSPPSIFQQSFPDEKSSEFKNSILSDLKLLTALFSIGGCLLIDKLPVRYIKPVVEREFSNKAEFLSGLDLENIEDKDGIVSVRYSKDGKAYIIKVCAKEKVHELDIEKSQWAVSSRFGIRVAEIELPSGQGADREKISEEMNILRKAVAKADEERIRLENEKRAIDARMSILKETAKAGITKSEIIYDETYDRIKTELSHLEKQSTQLDERLRDLAGKRISILDRISLLRKDIEAIGREIKASSIEGARPGVERQSVENNAASPVTEVTPKQIKTSTQPQKKEGKSAKEEYSIQIIKRMRRWIITIAFTGLFLINTIIPAFASTLAPYGIAIKGIFNGPSDYNNPNYIHYRQAVYSSLVAKPADYSETLKEADKVLASDLSDMIKRQTTSLRKETQEKIILLPTPETIPQPPEVSPQIEEQERIEQENQHLKQTQEHLKRIEAEDKQRQEKLSQAEGELAKIKQQNIAFQSQIAKLTQEQNGAISKIKILEDKRVALEGETSALKDKLKTTEMVLRIEQRISSREEYNKNWWRRLDSSWKVILSILGAITIGIGILYLKKRRQGLEQLKEEISGKEREKARLDQEIQSSRNTLQDVKKEIEKSKTFLTDTEKNHIAQEEKVQKAMLELSRLKTEIDKLNDELIQLTEEKNRVLQDLEKKTIELKADITKKEALLNASSQKANPPEASQTSLKQEKMIEAEINEAIEFLESLSSKAIQGLLRSQKIDLKERIRFLHDELGLDIVSGRGRSLLSRNPENLSKQKIFLESLNMPLTVSNLASSKRSFARKELKEITKYPEWQELTNEEKLSMVSHLYDIYGLRASWLSRDNDWYYLLHYFELPIKPINYTPRSIDFIQRHELFRFQKFGNIQQTKERLSKIREVIEILDLKVTRLLDSVRTKEGFEFYITKPEVYEGKLEYDRQYYPLPKTPFAPVDIVTSARVKERRGSPEESKAVSSLEDRISTLKDEISQKEKELAKIGEEKKAKSVQLDAEIQRLTQQREELVQEIEELQRNSEVKKQELKEAVEEEEKKISSLKAQKDISAKREKELTASIDSKAAQLKTIEEKLSILETKNAEGDTEAESLKEQKKALEEDIAKLSQYIADLAKESSRVKRNLGPLGLTLDQLPVALPEPYSVMIFDVDNTLTDVTSEINGDLLAVLLDFLSGGVEIALVTAQSFEEVKRYIIKLVPKEKRRLLKNLSVYPSGGARRFNFDDEGNAVNDADYDATKGLTLTVKPDDVKDAIQKVIGVNAGIGFRDGLITITGLSNREEAFGRLVTLFKEEGWHLVPRLAGGHTIHVLIGGVDKAKAAAHFVKERAKKAFKQDIPKERILVIGDSFYAGGLDADLISALPGASIVSVGRKPRPSQIRDLTTNGLVFSEDLGTGRNWQATLRILEEVRSGKTVKEIAGRGLKEENEKKATRLLGIAGIPLFGHLFDAISRHDYPAVITDVGFWILVGLGTASIITWIVFYVRARKVKTVYRHLLSYVGEISSEEKRGLKRAARILARKAHYDVYDVYGIIAGKLPEVYEITGNVRIEKIARFLEKLNQAKVNSYYVLRYGVPFVAKAAATEDEYNKGLDILADTALEIQKQNIKIDSVFGYNLESMKNSVKDFTLFEAVFEMIKELASGKHNLQNSFGIMVEVLKKGDKPLVVRWLKIIPEIVSEGIQPTLFLVEICEKSKDAFSALKNAAKELKKQSFDVNQIFNYTFSSANGFTDDIAVFKATCNLIIELAMRKYNPQEVSTTVVPPAMRSAKDANTKVARLNIILRLILEGIHPTQLLVETIEKTTSQDDLTIQLSQWLRLRSDFKTGLVKFDTNNPVHVDLEYTTYRKLASQLHQTSTYENYQSMIQQFRAAPGSSVGLSAQEQSEIKVAVYEAYRLLEFIIAVKNKADTLGRPVWVVPNLTYGKFAVSPILDELAKLNIEVHYARVSSGESHENPELVKQALFTDDVYLRILKERPIIIAVDGTQHLLARPRERKSARYPDAYVGYRNLVVALDEVFSDRKDEKFLDKVKVDKGFLSTLRRNSQYTALVDKLKKLSDGLDQPALLYHLEFWNPGSLELVVRQARKEVQNVTPLNPDNLDSPALIFVNSPLLDEDVPADIKAWAKLAQPHIPAFFDDTAQIQQTVFAVNGRGIYLSHALDFETARTAEELKDVYKGRLPQVIYQEPTQEALRSAYEAMLFDLDGTLTDTLSEIDKSLLNKLTYFLRSGVVIGIVTSQSFDEVKKYVIDKVDSSDGQALEQLVVFTARGAQAWGFDRNKKPYSIYDRSKTDIDDAKRQSIREVVNQALGTLAQDIEVMDRQAQITIPLRENKDKRDLVNATLNQLIASNNLPFQTEYSGASTIHVVMKGVDKGTARDYFLNQVLPERLKHPIDKSKLLVVGDRFQSGGSDRPMITKGARVVSVGGDDKSIPKGVEVYPHHGWKGTNLLLSDVVNKAGKSTVTLPSIFIGVFELPAFWNSLNDIFQNLYDAAKKPLLYIGIATLGLAFTFALITSGIKFYKTYHHYAQVRRSFDFLEKKDRIAIFREISRHISWRKIQNVDSYELFIEILPGISKEIGNRRIQEMADLASRLKKIKINPRHVFKYALPAIASKAKDEKEFIQSLSIAEKFSSVLQDKRYDYHLLLKEILPQVTRTIRDIDEFNETLLLGITLVKSGRSPAFALTKMLPEVTALTKSPSEFKMGMYALQELCLEGFESTKYLLSELIRLGTHAKIDQALADWQDIRRKFKTGEVPFTPKNELYLNLEYTTFRELVDRTLKQTHRYSFNEYLTILKNFNHNNKSAHLGGTKKAEIKYAAYEAFRFRRFVLKVKKQADKMNRSVWVVPNLSYGRFAVSPLIKDLAKDGVEVHYARIGSSESHDNPRLVKPDLFSAALYDRIMNEQPIIIVVDGTQHLLARPKDRKSARYPDAYVGYRNMIIAVNDILSGGQEQFFKYLVKTKGSFIRHLREKSNYRTLRRRLMRLYRFDANIKHHLYDIEFWNPGGLGLAVREARKEVSRVTPVSASHINRPTLIFVNSAMLDEDIPVFIRQWATKGRKIHHKPAYFDDTSHIQNLIFNVDASGVSLSDSLNKNIYREYKRIKGIYRPSFTLPVKPQDSLKLPYKAVISDLDGTLTNTLQEVPKPVIEKLLYLLSIGIQVAIVTTQSYQEVEKYLLSQIPATHKALLQNLSIYAATGSQGFGFDKNGNSLQEPRYDKTVGKLTDRQMQVWRRIIELSFEEYGLDKEVKDRRGQVVATPVKVIDAGSQIIIRLKERGYLRREIVKGLGLALNREGLPIALKEIGNTSIRMTIRGVNKSNAVKYHLAKVCKDKFGAEPKPQEVLILGNNFDEDGDDRDMMIRGAKVFSVGHKPILHYLKAGVNFYPVRSWEGSDQLLSELINILPIQNEPPKLAGQGVRLNSILFLPFLAQIYEQPDTYITWIIGSLFVAMGMVLFWDNLFPKKPARKESDFSSYPMRLYPPKPPRDVVKYLTTRTESIRQRYPGVRIGVIGATAPTRMYNPVLGEELGRILRSHVADKGFVFTGGVSGVGVDVYRGVVEASNGDDDRFFVLLPEGMWPGRDYREISPTKRVHVANIGEDMFERRIGMGRIADVLIVLNGRNGTLHEAVSALKNGREVIALDYGGAGSLLYEAKVKNKLSKMLIHEGLKSEYLENIIPADITNIEEALGGKVASSEEKKARMEKELARLTGELKAVEEEISSVTQEKNDVDQKINLLNVNLRSLEKEVGKARMFEDWSRGQKRLYAARDEIWHLELRDKRIEEKLEDLLDAKKRNEEKLAELRKNINRIEKQPQDISKQEEPSAIGEAKAYADNFVKSIVVRAREARRLGQKLIIGFETSWIPGYERGGLEHMALNPLVRELEQLEQKLNNLGLDNVIIVDKSGDELAETLLYKAQKTDTLYSNIVVLASQGTVNSKAFERLRSAPDEKRAFLAAIDTAELDKYRREHPENLEQLYIRIIEMMNIALELSLGKEPPNNPLIILYDKENRMVIFLPQAEPVNFEELKKLYDAQRQAIIAA